MTVMMVRWSNDGDDGDDGDLMARSENGYGF